MRANLSTNVMFWTHKWPSNGHETWLPENETLMSLVINEICLTVLCNGIYHACIQVYCKHENMLNVNISFTCTTDPYLFQVENVCI